MISEVFDQMKSTIMPLVGSLSGIVGNVDLECVDTTTLQEWQSIAINIGEVLERQYLVSSETPVIHLLESMCEDIFQLSQLSGVERKTQLIHCIYKKLNQFDSLLSDSVMVKDTALAITAIMRDEAKYIEEWINYHRIVGVEHFYLYDNESSDNTLEILRPYIESGIVSVKDWPGERVQLSAYNDALENYRNEVRYIAFIDVDEFIVPTQNGMTIPDVIGEIVENADNHESRIANAGGVGVNWLMFGTSNHKEPTDGLIIRDYLCRGEMREEYNCHVKLICNPRVVAGFVSTPHNADFKPGYVAVSERGSYLFNSPVFYDASYEKLRIHHYYSRSEKECVEKMCRRGWPDQAHVEISVDDERVQRYLKLINENYNMVYDDKMLYYADKVKTMIEELQAVDDC